MIKAIHFKDRFFWPENMRIAVNLTFDFQGGEDVRPDKDGKIDHEEYTQCEYGPNTAIWRILRILAEENVLLWVTKVKPDDMILHDPFARPWVRSYTLAMCKGMLGEAYSKFSQVIGPGGGVNLKGDALKAESVAEIEKLETELLNYVDNGTPYGIVIG